MKIRGTFEKNREKCKELWNRTMGKKLADSSLDLFMHIQNPCLLTMSLHVNIDCVCECSKYITTRLDCCCATSWLTENKIWELDLYRYTVRHAAGGLREWKQCRSRFTLHASATLALQTFFFAAHFSNAQSQAASKPVLRGMAHRIEYEM